MTDSPVAMNQFFEIYLRETGDSEFPYWPCGE